MNSFNNNPYYQHTLCKPIHFVGRGIHTDKAVNMTLLPAGVDTGIVFERLDVQKPQAEIQARWHRVTDTRLSTRITNIFGVGVSTIEHLMASLSACGVDNARILIDGPEVPIMDGSADPFMKKIKAVGLAEQAEQRAAFVVTRPIWIKEANKSAGFIPFPQPWLDMTIDFATPVIGKQSFSMPLDEAFFSAHIAKARTFGFDDQLVTLRHLGLAQGGNLSNAVLIRDDQVVNDDGLRFKDEFVRHKLLDAVGDFALAGMPIYGRFVGSCSGHDLNNKLLKKLLWSEDTGCITTVAKATTQWSEFVMDESYETMLNAAC